MSALAWCCARPTLSTSSPATDQGTARPRRIVRSWSCAGAAVGALFGGSLGGLILLANGFWSGLPIGVAIGAVVGGGAGLLVGVANGVVLTTLARTTPPGAGEGVRLPRIRCAAMTTTGLATVVLGHALVGEAFAGTGSLLFVYLPAAVGVAGAAALSRRLPPGRT